MKISSRLAKVKVLEVDFTAASWDEILNQIYQWGAARESRIICISNVHSLITAREDPAFGAIVNDADLTTPDGAPIAWLISRLFKKRQARINGPDLMFKYCQLIENTPQSIFLYGSSDSTLSTLKVKLLESFPQLKIAGTYSPPYRPLTYEEDLKITDLINKSGAGTVWISLGCPKQERWMADHRTRIMSVMIGVGAAFDYHAGTLKRAPHWMQNSGLEWFYRLLLEPKRLWRRYLVTNSKFIILVVRNYFRAFSS